MYFKWGVSVSNSFTSEDSQTNGNLQGMLTQANMKTYSSDSTGECKVTNTKELTPQSHWENKHEHIFPNIAVSRRCQPHWDQDYSVSFSASGGFLRNVMCAQNAVALQSLHHPAKDYTGAAVQVRHWLWTKLLDLQIKTSLGTLGRGAARRNGTKWKGRK